jgi:hypothetical protein
MVALLVNDGLGNRLPLSVLLLKALTAGVNGPGVFHSKLMVAPEAVALTGDSKAFNAPARAEATSLAELWAGWPLQTEFVLFP